MSRTGRIEFHVTEAPNLKKIMDHQPYTPVDSVKHQSMDFDMKRKPIFRSFSTDIVVVDSQTYEIAHFRTEPFHDIDEYSEYVQIKKKQGTVLRTKDDWASSFPDKAEEINAPESIDDNWR